jgi:uncharacterized membrane protein
MAAILSNLSRAVILSVVLAIALFAFIAQSASPSGIELGTMRFLHVISGVMWIGLLWYFNFVQIPTMPKVPAELKGGVTKFIAPEALFWFRWSALATVVFGLLLAWRTGYLADALLLGTVNGQARIIGIGMWLGLIMFFNVWAVIWPNQKKALGIVQVDAETAAKAGRTAMLFSRTNMVLSIPMLLSMVAQMHLG